MLRLHNPVYTCSATAETHRKTCSASARSAAAETLRKTRQAPEKIRLNATEWGLKSDDYLSIRQSDDLQYTEKQWIRNNPPITIAAIRGLPLHKRQCFRISPPTTITIFAI